MFGLIRKRQQTIKLAKRLRYNMTKAERKLSRSLKTAFPNDIFQSQIPIGPYIVDFVHPDSKLIIEADGGQHNENASDIIRDRYLRLRGYKTLRFWNNEIMENIDGVLITIQNHLKTL